MQKTSQYLVQTTQCERRAIQILIGQLSNEAAPTLLQIYIDWKLIYIKIFLAFVALIMNDITRWISGRMESKDKNTYKYRRSVNG